MKKLLLIFGILLSAYPAKANDDYIASNMWRSTQVATANLFNVPISTYISASTNVVPAAYFIHKVIINSAAAGSTLKFFRGNNSTATAILFETIDTSVNREITYDQKFSSGVFYGKSGAADITISWDFVVSVPTSNYHEGKR